MKYHFFFPNPVSHHGMFKFRKEVIKNYHSERSHLDNYHFDSNLPDAEEINKYMKYIAKNEYSKEYFGSLMSDEDSWKFTASFSDLKNLKKGFELILSENIQYSYFMTNSAGHHADNMHYELFCPVNQLFFIVEFLNYNDNFPEIFWVDTDAHLGNGDKAIFDKYTNKMRKETNNLAGISIHNDAGGLVNENYVGIQYSKDISEKNFLNIINSLKIPSVRYLLLFLEQIYSKMIMA